MVSWTDNPKYKKWKKQVHNHQTKKVKARPATDMCRAKTFCAGAKNIPRNLMPQIYNAKKFSRNIKRKFNISSKKTTMKARNLKPSQNEINVNRVDDVIKGIKTKKMTKNPIVVSKDGYVVDGHHRWAAYKKLNPNKKLPVMMMNAPIKDALGIAIAAGTEREKF